MDDTTKIIIIATSILIVFLSAVFFIPKQNIIFNRSKIPTINQDLFNSLKIRTPNVINGDSSSNTTTLGAEKLSTSYSTYFIDKKVYHLKAPKIVKGVYLTKNTFASVNKINEFLDIISKSNLNTAVIDVVSTGDPLFIFNKNVAKARLSLLHDRKIYLIARIVTLNDGNNGWYDPLSENRRWQLVNIAKRAINYGFDEINFDYIRYPGPYEPQIFDTPTENRTKNMTSLFKFLKENIRDNFNIPISIDIFGSTFIYPEKNIGQNMEEASKYFDYIMPMPYPSHWADWTFGFKKPGEHPHDVVYNALKFGWDKIKNNKSRISKLRIWVQDFNLKSITPISYLKYTPKMIHDQIFACYENGCSGWVLWNPNNNYKIKDLNISKTDPYINVSTSTSSTTTHGSINRNSNTTTSTIIQN